MSTYHNIMIIKDSLSKPCLQDNTLLIDFDELKRWIRTGRLLKHLFRYKRVELFTYKITTLPKPFLTAAFLFMLSRGICIWRDEQDNELRVTFRTLFYFAKLLITSFRKRAQTLSHVRNEVNSLSKEIIKSTIPKSLILSNCPFYLRTDLTFGLRSGGSVGHIAGVLNNLEFFTGKPTFLSTDYIPIVKKDIATKIIIPESLFWDFRDLLQLSFNDTFYRIAKTLINNNEASFIYQRYSTNNYAGVKLSKSLNLPFVLEYNGSEIWINRNWGKSLKYEELSLKIENLNLMGADIIVVVSQAMKEELVGRGIPENKILINPNGVDPKYYSPEIDGSGIRKQYGLFEKTVIGFIGTFGKWHGAEVLVDAFGNLLQRFPEYRSSTRLFLIGDGVMMPLVKEKLAQYNIQDLAILPGTVHQEKGPEYLAACDILASPHVPNPDGSPFFGSPTKLFEYMAMGKGIVASDLAQIGDILAHDKTAWMVTPGDINGLASGLKTLIADKDLRTRLGKAAREDVVSRFTWMNHTQKIISKLRECLS